MATQLQIDTYITDIRSAVADYGKALAVQQEIGNHDTNCGRLKLILLSAYLDCLYDYFLQYGNRIDEGESDPSDCNFFTTTEIRDIMQHMNNILGTFYIIDLE
jgi:hypothetical protein